MTLKPGFEFLEHTADIKIRAIGKTLEEAFINIAKAMTEELTDLKKVKKEVKKEVRIKANRMESLLYDFIDHLIYLQDTEDFMVADFEDLTINKETFELKGTAVGDLFHNYETYGDLKSATYHEMKIEEKDGFFILEVVLDV